MVEDYKVTEVWKDIPKYKGYYQDSNLGNIRSVPRVLSTKQMYKGHVLKPKVGIYDFGNSKSAGGYIWKFNL